LLPDIAAVLMLWKSNTIVKNALKIFAKRNLLRQNARRVFVVEGSGGEGSSLAIRHREARK
jgi:hypothetical protein